MTHNKAQTPRLADIGIAAGLVAMFLFGVLYGTTGHPAALIVGCGGGLLLLIASAMGRAAPQNHKN
jgi:MFS superfamily sulfate permease-like transporter